MIDSLNFVNISCCSCNDLDVLDITGNKEKIIEKIRDGREQNVDIFVFPELCLTGCTCADIFSQQFIYDDCVEAVNSIALNVGLELVFISSPLKVGYKVYNCVFALHNHKVIGIIPKTYVEGDRELRWFSSGDDLGQQGINIAKYTDINNTTEVLGYAFQLSNVDSSLKDCLLSIVDTPISPELLPTNDDGTVKQLTEDSIGSYVLNDFFMYYLLKYGMSFEKIHYLSRLAFSEIDKESLLSNLKNFILRFYTQQFKRSCMPDGIQVCGISLSPREGWKCPSDISKEALNNILDKLDNKVFHFSIE